MKARISAITRLNDFSGGKVLTTRPVDAAESGSAVPVAPPYQLR
jgi:hypothetical protein